MDFVDSKEKKTLLESFGRIVENPNLVRSLQFYDIIRSKPNKKMAKQFAKCAEVDLYASKVLYSKKDYSNAIFHLQQAVEKLAKAYTLQTGFMTIEEIKGVRHDTPEVFLKLLTKKRIWPIFDMVNEISEVKVDTKQLPEVRKISKRIKKIGMKVEVARFSREQIKSILTLCDGIEKGFQKARSVYDQKIAILKNQSKELWNMLKPQLEMLALHADPNMSEKTVKNMLENFKPEFLDRSANFIELFILSIITYPHAVFTRYPDGDVMQEDYLPGLGIVDEIEGIWIILERCMSLP